jgi:hypothetical protein
MWSLPNAFTSAFKKLDPIRNSRRRPSWAALSPSCLHSQGYGPFMVATTLNGSGLFPVRRPFANPIRVAEESTRAFQRLRIMEIYGAVMEFLHYGQDSSPRARGNEQPTG